MNNFYKDLEKYFENTPQSKILEDWAKSKDFDEIGPSIEEFFKQLKRFEVIEKIQDWIRDRNLHTQDPRVQMCKTMEELGELANAINKTI